MLFWGVPLLFIRGMSTRVFSYPISALLGARRPVSDSSSSIWSDICSCSSLSVARSAFLTPLDRPRPRSESHILSLINCASGAMMFAEESVRILFESRGTVGGARTALYTVSISSKKSAQCLFFCSFISKIC